MMKCLPWYLHERARSRTTYAASFITMPLAAASSECFIFQVVPPAAPLIMVGARKFPLRYGELSEIKLCLDRMTVLARNRYGRRSTVTRYCRDLLGHRS